MWDKLRRKRIYLDTNIVIYTVEANKLYSEQLRALMREVDDGVVVAVTSELSLAEVLVKPIAERAFDVVKRYESFFSHETRIELFPIDRATLRHAAEIRAVSKLRLPDAIHLASALASKCQVFLSNDRVLRLPATIRHVTLQERPSRQ